MQEGAKAAGFYSVENDEAKMGDTESGSVEDKKNLTILVNRAIEASKSSATTRLPESFNESPIISNIIFAREISGWGIVYSVLGDTDAGNDLFNRALTALNEQIEHVPPNVTISPREPKYWERRLQDDPEYKAQVSFVQKCIERGEGLLIKLPRDALVKIPMEDLKFLHGMMQDYYKMLHGTGRIDYPYFMESIAATGRKRFRLLKRKELPPITKPLPSILKELPKRVTNDAASLVGRHSTALDSDSYRIRYASVAREVYQEYANRLVAKYNITPLK